MVPQFFKTAWRSLRRSPVTSGINIIGLAIGIACTTLIFLWVEDELSFDSVNTKKGLIYQLNVSMPGGGSIFTMGSTPRPLAAAIKSEIPGIRETARASDFSGPALFSWKDKTVYLPGKYADPGIFSMFSFDFIEGNSAAAFPITDAVVFSESGAKKLFGTSKGIVGKQVRIDNQFTLRVYGIVKDLPENSSFRFDWVAPYLLQMRKWNNTTAENDAILWGSYGPYTYVELDKDVSPEKVGHQLAAFIQQKDAKEKSICSLLPMKDWHLRDEYSNGKPTGSGRIRQVRLMAGVGWLILLIACFNFMNLSTASSERRRREIGVRKVLGSGKGSLAFQFLGEAVLLAAVSTLLAVFLAQLSLSLFNGVMGKSLTLDLFRPAHLLFLLIITVVTGLIAGSYPAHFLSSFRAAIVLKGGQEKTGAVAGFRRALVVSQFAVSVVFIIATIVIFQQIRYIENRDIGFNRSRLIEFDWQHDMGNRFPVIHSEMLRTGMLSDVALAGHSLLQSGNSDNTFTWQGKPPGMEQSIYFREVSAGFIGAMGLRLEAGEGFSSDPSAAAQQVVINQSLERMVGKGSAVGKVIRSPRNLPKGQFTNLVVTGVLKNYVFGNAAGTADPVMFLNQNPDFQWFVYARLKPGISTPVAMAGIENVFKSLNPGFPMVYHFVDEQFAGMFSQEVALSKVAGTFAVLAIAISCLGLFGLAAFTAERRTKEISIRKLLGAGTAGLAMLISEEFLKLIGIACLIAFPVAWWIMHQWLQGYEYRISISAGIFVSTGLGAAALCLATVSLRTLRTIHGNLVRQLRSE